MKDLTGVNSTGVSSSVVFFKYYDSDKHKKEVVELLCSDDGKRYLNSRFNKVDNLLPDDCQYNFGIVATDNEGMVIGYAKASLSSMKSQAYIDEFIISKAYRGSGVGRQMLKKIESELLSSYVFTHIYCYTIENNNMNNFLEKNGYENKGTYEEFVMCCGKLRDQSIYRKKVV